MFEEVFETVELLKQRGRGLVADAGNAGNVVGGVANERFIVCDAFRSDAVAFAHGCGVVDLDFRDAALRDLNVNGVIDELQLIRVARQDDDAVALLFAARRQCAN